MRNTPRSIFTMKPEVLARIYFLILLSFLTAGSASCKHPILYYSSEEVEELQQKARTSHRHIFSRLREAAEEMKGNSQTYTPPSNWTDFSRSWNEIYGNSLISLAFYCVLNPTDYEAFGLARNIIKRFTVLRNWRCSLNIDDDVPVAHSLVAVATAYDFLWNRLDDNERHLIVDKIKHESRVIYQRSFEKWWGKIYIQNHMATNYMALMTAALVLKSKNDHETFLWEKRAHLMLNRTMFLLSFVTDGTLDEGVSYGSYTSRSLTQYIALAKRHFDIDFTKSEWLKKHFWFLYRTILPSFDEALGIADSNGKWFYGPESQLVFLDKMVLKNGFGNWLAMAIQRMRKDGKTLSLARAHCFATLYTEFLFYDEKIGERPPPVSNVSTLHIFKDWGVVVFGRGAETPRAVSRQKLSTFVSFKCGVLHGEAINNIVNTKPWPWIKGWRQFNPGHEHPDHGSFTFYPNGIPFITEALYGPKYTWLNNALLFGCSSSLNNACFTGQLSENKAWLRFESDTFWKAKGTILAAIAQHENVYITGEYSGWYNKELGLKKVYRTLLLVRSDLLIVCDSIFKKNDSSLDKMSAFFHNRFSPFSIRERKNGETFAEVIQGGQAQTVYWASSAGKTIDVRSQHAQFKAEAGKRKTNFVNITTPMLGHSTYVVYTFAGNNLKVRHLRLFDINGTVMIKMDLEDSTLIRITIPSRPEKYNTLLATRFDDYVDIEVEYEVEISDRSVIYLVGKLVFIGLLFLMLCFWYSFRLKGKRMMRKILLKILHKIEGCFVAQILN
ncbi:dermatan-sulfate epimerase-like protein [Actinia tenebrosa]|uniref:Dermatan-sulfate epimerase-like protein n=1 Tax=Actinia tenebrosa TaxID=6105 RepID=A0A6P8J238_ACTTE|nr:dermatan-sulfate epimerase-like protein [Actinia tenebrosa]